MKLRVSLSLLRVAYMPDVNSISGISNVDVVLTLLSIVDFVEL